MVAKFSPMELQNEGYHEDHGDGDRDGLWGKS